MQQRVQDRKVHAMQVTIRHYLRFGINPILAMALLAMVILSLSRLLLAIWQYDQLPEGGLFGNGNWFAIFAQGIRIDFASICGLFAAPLLILTTASLIPRSLWRVPKFILVLLQILMAAGIAFLVMNEMATPGFINEYGVRPNYIYVQYLIYPKEVFATLWGGHKLALLLSIIVTALTFYGAYRFSAYTFALYHQAGPIRSVVTLLLVLCIVPLGIRSTLGHRPLNPSMVAFSDNALVNTLPLNSSYSAVYAAFHLNDVTVGEDQMYKTVPDNESLAALPELSVRQVSSVPNSTKCPINQELKPFKGIFRGIDVEPTPLEHKPYNVVIILEESLGDNFVASQGGFPMTPYLEQLKEQGWWFENMYAAGHRSIRGIEAVTASMPPSALDSIVKLPQVGSYATIFKIFDQAGYETSFIYGGESHFDNMRNYFYGNGMQTVVEQKDYENPNFVASWGVSDEDLFARANEIFKKAHSEGKNFMSVVFSSSFHDPFEIPEGKVSLDGFKTDEPERLLAAKYADYAMGTYLEKAKHEDYYQDTIFLVIADHESRVRGAGSFPLNEFSIPAVIIGPNVEPYFDKRQVSQIDMAMTLMSLAGLEGSIPNIGQDLTRKDAKERAIMQFSSIFGYLQGQDFIAIAPSTTPYQYKVGEGDSLQLVEQVDPKRLDLAIKFSNLGPSIYEFGYMSSECIELKTKVSQ